MGKWIEELARRRQLGPARELNLLDRRIRDGARFGVSLAMKWLLEHLEIRISPHRIGEA